MSDDADLLREFLSESRENLDRLEHELMSYEGTGSSPDMLAAVFRTIHTVKGTAGFFGFVHLQHVTHTAENLLSSIRDGALELSAPIASCLLDVTDAAREILVSVEAGNGEGAIDHSSILSRLATFQSTARVEASAEVGPEEPAIPDVVVDPEPVRDTAPVPPVVVAAAAAPRVESTVRVDVHVLDRLMDLAGELVLARNQLLQLSSTSTDSILVRVAQRIGGVTSDLQDGVMRTRMQPIGGAWAKLPRVVRDLAAELDKQITLELVGHDTALDRTILEAIKDPLTHLVRNACDHGIELPARRIAAGKRPDGVLCLSASHGGGHVAIEIRDDGGGIDPERVRRRVIERNMMTAERANRLTDSELVQLIFAPGFSTAEKVTSVSGRGVGMDVVKTNVEAIGGTVTVRSVFGAGTTVRIDIPLTLAIIPALLISAGGQRYAIPEGAIVEILRIEPDAEAGELGIEYIHGAPVYRRHGELVPLIVLADLLAQRPAHEVATPAYVAVVMADGRKVGIVVDDLHDSEEIVVKPVGKPVQGIPLYAGATILGDGRIALILDVRGLADEAGLTTHRAPQQVAVTAEAPRSSVLVVRGRERRLALPLNEVSRLEEFAASSIERAGLLEVVQYRGRMLPLLRLADPMSDRVTVVVQCGGAREVGLLVDGIVDIVEIDSVVDTTSSTFGVHGSMVIHGMTTDLIDVAALAEQAGLTYLRSAS